MASSGGDRWLSRSKLSIEVSCILVSLGAGRSCRKAGFTVVLSVNQTASIVWGGRKYALEGLQEGSLLKQPKALV